jgi:hypothetical protein
MNPSAKKKIGIEKKTIQDDQPPTVPYPSSPEMSPLRRQQRHSKHGWQLGLEGGWWRGPVKTESREREGRLVGNWACIVSEGCTKAEGR